MKPPKTLICWNFLCDFGSGVVLMWFWKKFRLVLGGCRLSEWFLGGSGGGSRPNMAHYKTCKPFYFLLLHPSAVAPLHHILQVIVAPPVKKPVKNLHQPMTEQGRRSQVKPADEGINSREEALSRRSRRRRFRCVCLSAPPSALQQVLQTGTSLRANSANGVSAGGNTRSKRCDDKLRRSPGRVCSFPPSPLLL